MRVPELPDVNLPVPPPVVQLLGDLRTRTQARKDHLKDEVGVPLRGGRSSTTCDLKAVSFIKPIGEETEHPAIRARTRASRHPSCALKAIEGSACAKDTMVIVTYDEFGGQWDHVPPPGQGSTTAWPSRPVGPRHAHSALIVAPPAVRQLRRRLDRALHVVDPRDDRASLRRSGVDQPRPDGGRPVERLDREAGPG